MCQVRPRVDAEPWTCRYGSMHRTVSVITVNDGVSVRPIPLRAHFSEILNVNLNVPLLPGLFHHGNRYFMSVPLSQVPSPALSCTQPKLRKQKDKRKKKGQFFLFSFFFFSFPFPVCVCVCVCGGGGGG